MNTILWEQVAQSLCELRDDRTNTKELITIKLLSQFDGLKDRDDVYEAVRKYLDTNASLSDVAQSMVRTQGSWLENPTCQPCSEILLSKPIIQPNFAIHNGVVVSLEQKRFDGAVVDNTNPEIKDIPVSEDYFKARIEQLYPDCDSSSYFLRRLVDRINGEGRRFDIAEFQHNEQQGLFVYAGVEYNQWSTKTVAEAEQELAERKQIMAEAQAKQEQQRVEQESLAESLGLNKFDNPDAAYQVYLMLQDSDSEFKFDLNLMEEVNDETGHPTYACFTYDGEEFAVWQEDSIYEANYEREVENIRDNPYDYADGYCDSVSACEALENIEDYNSEQFEGTDDFFVVRR
jgi:hypothetical protein